MNDARDRPFGLGRSPRTAAFASSAFLAAIRAARAPEAISSSTAFRGRPAQWFEKFDPITADFTYVRWLGDRKGIEKRTKVWNEVIVDRRTELSEWADILGKVHKRKIQIYAYANNHYAGYGPATVEMFRDLWRKLVSTERGKASRAAEQGQLFK